MTAPVPILPDGTPNFPAGSSGSIPAGTGQVTIWNQIVKPVTQEMSTLGINKIWFGVGTKKSIADALSPSSIDTAAARGAGAETSLSTVPGAETGAQVGSSATRLVDIEHPAVLKTPEKIMADFYAMSYDDPAKFIALQKALAEGPWGTVDASGSMDGKTESALVNAMSQWVKLKSTGVEVSLSQYILDAAQRRAALNGGATGSGGSGGSSSAVFQPQVSDPAQIRAQAEQAFQAAIGRGATKSELSKFVAEFQAAQTSAERTAFDNKGTVTSPDLAAQANQFAQQSDPGQYHQHQATAYTNALVNLLMGSTARPNIAPVAQA